MGQGEEESDHLLQKASNFEISFSGKRRVGCLMQTPLVNFTQVYFEKEVWRDDNQKFLIGKEGIRKEPLQMINDGTYP